LLWNPDQDDRALIKEFLAGYFGERAAEPIFGYLELMRERSKGVFLGCFLRGGSLPHLNFATLARAESLWQEAESATRGDAEKLPRVRLAHLPVRDALLQSWVRLRRECWEQNGTWPLPASRKAVAEEFRAVCEGVPGKDWTRVNVMNEQGLTVENFLKKFTEDPPEKEDAPPPVRLKKPAAPPGVGEVDLSKCVDAQDNLAGLYKPGEFAEIRFDDAASDLRAVWMPGSHQEWAFRIAGAKLPVKAQSGKWKVYAVVRVEKLTECKEDSVTFAAGVYDNKSKQGMVELKGRARQGGDGYNSYVVGTVEMNADRDIWVAPAKNPGVKAIWVDRIFLVPGE
jgi:hypothetical protein